MATKLKSHVLPMQHTAGIFSDMAVDGPLIGTLVLVVDRAKNLPNRKTIGKQDPYCAARLGKEAKKTTTDIRGGQTPRWDQELRFNVHDSPDYYQLKVSVFNDDKKTELIGEAWIDLRDTIVSGGGQTDIWHQLTCRGKYAGEIRIEITFYDTRPKPEKPPVKARPSPAPSEVDGARPRPAGPKRRPLPSDPLTGQAPSPQPQPLPEPVSQTPPRPQPNSPITHIPTQSPLQQVEYNTPPPGPARYQQQEQYPSAPLPADAYGHSNQEAVHEVHTPERHDEYLHHPDERYASPNMHPPSFDVQYQRTPREHEARYQVGEHSVSPVDDRPPPPPVHRIRHNTGASPDQILLRNAHESLPARATPPTIRQEVLRNEAHRHTMSGTYPGRPTYKPANSAPTVPNGQSYSPIDTHQASPPRHHSYDQAYDAQHRSMQPTVEEAPDSPDQFSPMSFRQSSSGVPEYDSRYNQDYDQASSPAPLNLGGRGSVASNHYNQLPAQEDQYRRASFSQEQPSSLPSSRDYRSHDDLRREPPQPDFYNDRGQPLLPYHGDDSYAMPSVPSSLVPGVDSSLMMEVCRRINEDRRSETRYTQSALVENSLADKDRRMTNGHSHYSTGSPLGGYGSSQHSRGRSSRSSLNHAAPPEYHSEQPASGYPSSTSPNASANTHHIIKRKSISPAPPRSADESRRLSGVPFGPDSYNALNPALAAATSTSMDAPALGPDYNDNGMIISHDGREVDPSDHLPVDTWAPEPEPRKSTTAAPSPSVRPVPGGPQSQPPSTGRRPLRVAVRAQTAGPEPGYISSDVSFDASTPTKAAPTVRNRLQKKAHRASALPVMSGANGSPSSHQPSSPLAPLPLHQDNFTPPRNLPRAQTFDYPSENHAPAGYGSGSPLDGHGHGSYSRGNYRASMSGPPIPEKMPIAHPPTGSGAAVMSGALPAPTRSNAYDEWGDMRQGSSAGELSLMEEMQRIDIGTGRARRHGQSYGY